MELRGSRGHLKRFALEAILVAASLLVLNWLTPQVARAFSLPSAVTGPMNWLALVGILTACTITLLVRRGHRPRAVVMGASVAVAALTIALTIGVGVGLSLLAFQLSGASALGRALSVMLSSGRLHLASTVLVSAVLLVGLAGFADAALSHPSNKRIERTA